MLLVRQQFSHSGQATKMGPTNVCYLQACWSLALPHYFQFKNHAEMQERVLEQIFISPSLSDANCYHPPGGPCNNWVCYHWFSQSCSKWSSVCQGPSVWPLKQRMRGAVAFLLFQQQYSSRQEPEINRVWPGCTNSLSTALLLNCCCHLVWGHLTLTLPLKPALTLTSTKQGATHQWKKQHRLQRYLLVVLISNC